MLKQWNFKQKYTLKLFIAFKITDSWCFSLGGKFYNIDYMCVLQEIKTAIVSTRITHLPLPSHHVDINRYNFTLTFYSFIA